jgi:uncharacterized protein YceH (UPF0502 family)
MKNHSRLYNLLAAGSLTVLLLITFLLFRNNHFGGVADAATTAVIDTGTLSAGTVSTATQSTVDPAVAALEAQNQKLMEAVQVLQAREGQYQTQLDNATQALQRMQGQSGERLERHEREYGEHEYGEHEYGEHEYGEHEYGEHGDDD